VTTDAPGVNDVIIEGENGVKAESGNVDDITAKMIKVLKNPELSAKLSEKSLTMAEEIYDWKVVTGRYIDLYKKVIGDSSRT
jgi:glycosyltransferase involved in cell wall biosynthesis